ncbi:cysteine hydrolase family protein [Acidisoma sp. C75]
MPPHDEWLMVVDMQRAFADPPSRWASAGFYEVLPRVEKLIAAYAGRVVLTRYIAPLPPMGAWQAYFADWPEFLLPEGDPAWDLKLAVTDGMVVHTRATFNKWDAALAARLGPDVSLALCGVATDCCVLATALAAIDDGRPVRLITDACAGGSPEAHDHALTLLGYAAPLLRCVTTAEILAEGA